MPDYLGLGSSPSYQGYGHARSEATCVVDALRAGRSLCASNNVTLNGQLFLTGYSEGGQVTMAAHRELEALCLDRELAHFKQHVGLKYAEVVYFGLWFTPLRESLQAFVESSQGDVSGTVTLALYKGNFAIAGRKSETSMYRPDVASFTMGTSYDQKDAEGFIRILGLPARSRALIHRKTEVVK